MMESRTDMTSAELRKINKPLVEKKRRARINENLNMLKSLIVDSTKHDSARYSKLEKADILEMTVQTLKQAQRRQTEVAVRSDPTVAAKYRTGFTECAQEVKRYLDSVDGLGSDVRMRLMSHLERCMHKVNNDVTLSHPQQFQQPQSVHLHQVPYATPVSVLPGNLVGHLVSSPEPQHHQPNSMGQLSVIYTPRDISPNRQYQVSPPAAPQTKPTFGVTQPTVLMLDVRTPSPEQTRVPSADVYSGHHLNTSHSTHAVPSPTQTAYKMVGDRKHAQRRERVWRPW